MGHRAAAGASTLPGDGSEHAAAGQGKHELQKEMGKWMKFYRPVDNIPIDITNSGREEHARLRRALSHGFSDRCMREQQPLIKGYIDLLIRRLREHGRDGTVPVDMVAWYNFTTFDVIGDLAFGERWVVSASCVVGKSVDKPQLWLP